MAQAGAAWLKGNQCGQYPQPGIVGGKVAGYKSSTAPKHKGEPKGPPKIVLTQRSAPLAAGKPAQLSDYSAAS